MNLSKRSLLKGLWNYSVSFIFKQDQNYKFMEVSYMGKTLKEEKEYKVFEMFDSKWAVVTAGSMEHYNSCTVLRAVWGIFGDCR